MGTPERSDHISTKSVLFKVGLKVPTPKHEVVAAEGTAKGGRIGEDLFSPAGRRNSGQRAEDGENAETLY